MLTIHGTKVQSLDHIHKSEMYILQLEEVVIGKRIAIKNFNFSL